MKKLSNNHQEAPNAGWVENNVNEGVEQGNQEQVCDLLTSENTQTSYGKFATPEALLNAYNSLEVQFTKRSQELKRLERENLQLKEEQAKLLGEVTTSDCQSRGAEDETGIATTKQAEKEVASFESGVGDEEIAKEVSDFLSKNPMACEFAVEIAKKTGEIIQEEQSIDKSLLEKAYIAVLQDCLLAEKNKINDDFVYSMAKQSDYVREKIIRDYLGSFTANNHTSLLSGGGSSVIMPPKKPKDIREAGALAVGVIKRI